MNPQDMQRMRVLIDRLAGLTLEGPGRGGPYVGISHNDITRAIVAGGEEVVPILVEALESSTYVQAVFIVFCLRELQAKSARQAVRALRRSDKFEGVERDMSLDMQISYFLRDVDSW